MTTSRTFTNTVVLLCVSIAITLWSYSYTPPESLNRRGLIDIRINWNSSSSEKEMDRKVTTPLENWIFSIMGIRSIDSETGLNSATLQVSTAKNIDPGHVLAEIQRIIRINWHLLPKGTLWPDFNEQQSDEPTVKVISGEPFISNEQLLKQLITFMSLDERIMKVEHSQIVKEPPIYRFANQPTFFYDSLVSEGITNPMKPAKSLEFIKTKEQILRFKGKSFIPKLDYRPPSEETFTRFNGRPAFQLFISGTDLNVDFVMERLLKFACQKNIEAFFVPFPASDPPGSFRLNQMKHGFLLLFMFIAADMVFRRKQILLRLAIGLIIISFSGIAPPNSEQSAGSWYSFSFFAMTIALLYLFTTETNKKPLRQLLVMAVFFAIFPVFYKSHKFLPDALILFPLIYHSFQDKRHFFKRQLTDSNPKWRLAIFLIPAILCISPWKIHSRPTAQYGLWSLFAEKEKYQETGPVISSETEDIDASIFPIDLLTENEIFAYLRSLEDGIMKNSDHSAQILIRWSRNGYISVKIKSDRYTRNIKNFLTSKAIEASGLRWYISHGTFHFTNQSSPVFPSYTWKLSGYNQDTLYLAAEMIADSLRRTPRISMVRLFENSWLPKNPSESYRLEWKSEQAPLPSFGFEHTLDENGFEYKILYTPRDKWNLLNRIYHVNNRLLPGTYVMEEIPENSIKLIRKHNRSYIQTIGHEFNGTPRMAEQLYQKLENDFKKFIPAGIELNPLSGESELSHQDLVIFWLSVLFVITGTLICTNKPEEALFNTLRFCTLTIFYMLIMNFSKGITPADWYKILPLIAALCIIPTVSHKKLTIVYITASAVIFILNPAAEFWRAGYFTIVVGLLPIPRAGRWISKES